VISAPTAEDGSCRDGSKQLVAALKQLATQLSAHPFSSVEEVRAIMRYGTKRKTLINFSAVLKSKGKSEICAAVDKMANILQSLPSSIANKHIGIVTIIMAFS
jgi:hypothetical protein